MKKIVVHLAGVSDGQCKAGVDEGPRTILARLLPNKYTAFHNSVDFASKMTELHTQHQSVHRDDEGSVKEADSESFVELHNARSVGQATRQLQQDIVERHVPGQFTVVLGGDHSIAIGSISAIKKVNDGPLLVVWVDAHADFHSPLTTPSGNIHGCPVGFLTHLPGTAEIAGFEWLRTGKKGEEKNNGKAGPNSNNSYIDKLVYVGLRDVEREEVEHMDAFGAKALWMRDINKEENIAPRLREAISELDPNNLCQIHCSFDIDGLDPSLAPATGTPVPGGLSLAQAQNIFDVLHATGRFSSLDLVEVNPSLSDERGRELTLTTALAVLDMAMQ